MTVRAYQRQHLALFAAGYINSAGTTSIGIGCSLTRISAGVYGLILPSDAGLQDRQTFSLVTVKGTAARYKTVTDTSNVVKTISTFNETPTPTDTDIEVAVFRSVEAGG